MVTLIALFYGIATLSAVAPATTELKPTCDSLIYCQGPLLHTIQTARIFDDSKTFVDMRMKYSQNETLKKFEDFMTSHGQAPTRKEVSDFVNENFEQGSELEQYKPDDWTPEPSILKRITNNDMRKWLQKLNEIWPDLARRVRTEVSEHPERYSLEPLPHGFVIPGGRFKEPYYWDSYWIINGLLLSDMHHTARDMIDNLAWLVGKYGHVPNGGRVYYSMRSQPPLLTMMATRYVTVTRDLRWLKQIVPLLDKELKFWLSERSIKVGDHLLVQYNAPSTGPRPESYDEDVKTAKGNQTIYTELKSAAESGWDFSSRWFVDEQGGRSGNLSNLHTTRIVPVDLNAFFCGALDDLSDLYLVLNDVEKSKEWRVHADNWKSAVQNVLWNEEDGVWYDLLLPNKQHRKYFYPSNFAPLWTRCVPDSVNIKESGERSAKYLKSSGAMKYPGGLPTSLLQTGEQWDLTNAWPPLQSIVVQGLLNAGGPEASTVAKQLAEQWVRANFRGYQETEDMFEKYDAEKPGKYGGGGEYEVQSGFGWTNGVIFEMLNEFNDITPFKEDFNQIETDSKQ